MASVVEICNLALSSFGADTISSLDEDSTQARAAKLFYGLARDGLLSVYPWRFAGRQVTLAEIVNTQAGQWRHAYALPNDVLRVRLVRPQYKAGSRFDEQFRTLGWQVEEAKIYSDIGKAVLLYTGRVEDSGLYPPLFVAALVDELASRLAMALTRSGQLQGQMVQMAARSLAAAQMADAGQEPHFYGGLSEFELARGDC